MRASLHPPRAHFKSLALYLLSDKPGGVKGRVAWTSVVNLDSPDPFRAWRTMAFTAMKARALRISAGLPPDAGKTVKPVLHLSLSWPPWQAPSPPAMQEACASALACLGAQDHQALLVAHGDTEHAHVHLMANLVHPTTGAPFAFLTESDAWPPGPSATEPRWPYGREDSRAPNSLQEHRASTCCAMTAPPSVSPGQTPATWPRRIRTSRGE